MLLFAFVFGGVIAVPGGNYRDYLIGGILVQTLTFGIIGPAAQRAGAAAGEVVGCFGCFGGLVAESRWQ